MSKLITFFEKNKTNITILSSLCSEYSNVLNNVENRFGQTPLIILCSSYQININVFNFFIDKLIVNKCNLLLVKNEITALTNLLLNSNIILFKDVLNIFLDKLLLNNYDINQRILNGKTELMIYCKNKNTNGLNLEILKILLSKIEPNNLTLKDDNGNTAFNFLCSNKNINIENFEFFINLLKNNNLEINTTNKYGTDTLTLLKQNKKVTTQIIDLFILSI